MKLKLAILAFLLIGTESALAITPNDEVVAAVAHLEKIHPDEREFIKFFSTMAVPETGKLEVDGRPMTYREACVLVFQFFIHSISAGEVFAQPIQISPTLWTIDIRDYRWTPESFEKVSQLDPYFREPWVDGQVYRALQLESGNAVLRMDWFIVHVSDVTKQVDLGREPLYYVLTYSGSKIPETIDDFRKFWGADIPAAQANKTPTGTIVDHGQSGVSSHLRQIFRIRTILGYYYETEDVNSLRDGDDYLDNLVPDVREKNVITREAITSNRLRLQTYFLANKDGKRIEFGDNQVVTDYTDPLDKRVKTAKSCIACHNIGLNIPPNAVRELLDLGVSIKTYPKEFQNDLKRFYLGEFGTTILDDNILYERAVFAANGLTPAENSRLFREIIKWYESPLNIVQAALETGYTEEELSVKCATSIRGRILALTKGKNIPREAWEEIEGGIFGEIMLLMSGREPTIGIGFLETKKETKIFSGATELGIIPSGERVEIIETQNQWGRVEYQGIKGWIRLDETN